MPWEITYLKDTDVVFVRSRGRVDPLTLLAHAADTVQRCTQAQAHRYLLDVRDLVMDDPHVAVQDVPATLLMMGGHRCASVALVATHAQIDCAGCHAAERAADLAGCRHRIVRDVRDAIAWLITQPATPEGDDGSCDYVVG